MCACRKYVIYGSGASNALERRCQYKCFAFVYPYASVKNMGSAAAVVFFLGGGGVAPVLKLDRRQGSMTNAKTPVRRGEFAVPIRTPVRVLDWSEAAGKFSLL